VSSINEKLGLKRAGKRAMMKLPNDRAARNDLTAAKCPKCGQRGVRESVIHGARWRTCSWCGHGWEPTS
jgi:formate dehydrogenase maturation protein FdhE